MKTLLLKLTFVFFISALNAQTTYESNTEFGETPFKASQELKEKTMNIINSRTRFTGQEIRYIKDAYFFQLKDGSISYGPDIEYMHYRIIFDKNQNWKEIQELFHCDVAEDDIYFKYISLMKAQIKTKKELLCPNYFKITTDSAVWYELIVYSSDKKTKGTLYMFDKDLKLVKQKKVKIKAADYSKISND